MTEVSLRIQVSEPADYEAAKAAKQQFDDVNMQAQTAESSGGFESHVEPITAVLIGAGIIAAAKFVLDWWERRKGGLILDQSPGAVDQVRRDKNVPFGYVLIYPKDGGLVKVETKDMPKDSMQHLLEAVISGAYETANEVVNAANTLISGQPAQISQA